jgi:Sec-independent protein translocase protein TatA
MKANRVLVLAAGIITVVFIPLGVRYAVHERALHLEEQRQEMTRRKQQEMEADKRRQAEEQEKEVESEKKRQAEKQEKEAREALGDRIDAQVGYLGMLGPSSLFPFNSNFAFFTKNYHRELDSGYKIQNLSMFINRKNGALTIVFDCQFNDNPSSLARMLVRLFDVNGEYLTHFITAESFAAPGCRYHFSDPNSCSGGVPLKPESNLLQYTINLRDAAFVQKAEFGLYTRR